MVFILRVLCFNFLINSIAHLGDNLSIYDLHLGDVIVSVNTFKLKSITEIYQMARSCLVETVSHSTQILHYNKSFKDSLFFFQTSPNYIDQEVDMWVASVQFESQGLKKKPKCT